MAKRIVGDPCNILVNFRVSESMKNELDKAADSQNISSTEYIRRAVKEKLEREASGDNATAELEKRMTALEQQIRVLSQPYITQNAGRDAKMNVTKE